MSLPVGTAAALALATPTGVELQTYADREGHFSFPAVPAGPYVLRVDCPMYIFQDVGGAVGWRWDGWACMGGDARAFSGGEAGDRAACGLVSAAASG